MIRVVLDTNIIVSALLQPLGPPAQVFSLAITGSIQLCVSGEVYAEYEEVISRDSSAPRTLSSPRSGPFATKASGSGPTRSSLSAPIRTTTSFSNVRRPRAPTIW